MTTKKQERISLAIKGVISDLMERVMKRVLITDPFVKEKHHSKKPLYAALVPDEIFKGSHFERRFVTPFGGVWEKLALVVANEAHGHCIKSHEIRGTVGQESLRRIQETLNRLEHKGKKAAKTKPDWSKEIAYIKAGGGELLPVRIECNIFIDSKINGKTYAFILEKDLSNSRQNRINEEKLLKLMAMDSSEVDFIYSVIPYDIDKNQERNQLNRPIHQYNNYENKPTLIGSEFWNLIGGVGIYNILMNEVNALGQGYRKQIYQEFLEID